MHGCVRFIYLFFYLSSDTEQYPSDVDTHFRCSDCMLDNRHKDNGSCLKTGISSQLLESSRSWQKKTGILTNF